MTPGPKKQGGSRRSGQRGKVEDHKASNAVVFSPNPDNKGSEVKENDSKDAEVVGKNYKKRQIIKNLNRYEEPIVDPHADVSQGDDYEVLLSYSGGAGSQHRFADEKEWEEHDTGDMQNLTLDFNRLNESMKCIPFYKRLHLSAELFEPVQINKMDRTSEQATHSFSSLLKSQASLEKVQKEQSVPKLPEQSELPTKDSFMFQIEKEHPVANEDLFKLRAPVVDPETKRTAERITKYLTSDSTNVAKPVSKPEASKMDVADNDLDFLLSLSTRCSGGNIDAAKTEAISVDIDEWLSNILDK